MEKKVLQTFFTNQRSGNEAGNNNKTYPYLVMVPAEEAEVDGKQNKQHNRSSRIPPRKVAS
jgi:hypothetical protein